MLIKINIIKNCTYPEIMPRITKLKLKKEFE